METFVRKHTQTVNTHVGHHIRLARQMRKMTQGELAERINLTFQQVQKYEHGSSRISVATLALIARALDMSISYFLEGLQVGQQSGPESDGATQAPLSAEGWEIAALLTRISRRSLRRRLVAIAREIAEMEEEIR